MKCYTIEEKIPTFATVGALRDLLKDYPDDAAISICGVTGLFYGYKNKDGVLLETEDSSGYEVFDMIAGEIMDEKELEEIDY